MSVGEKIKIIRKFENMTQKRLSELSGISNTYISDIEKLRSVPSLKSLEKIAVALGVSVKDLLD